MPAGAEAAGPRPGVVEAGGAPPVETADEAERWRALAGVLLATLVHTQQARAEQDQRHAAEMATERAQHARGLVQDREGFLDLVAHELKTPVAVIKAYAELLEAQGRHGTWLPDTREVVGHILEQADVMSGLIEEVLDVQRLRLGRLPLEVGRVDLLQIARAVAQDVQHTTRTHTIQVDSPQPPPPVMADRRRLRQVLVNLLENAVKYAEGGPIQVAVGVDTYHDRPCALVSVCDQGMGIEPSAMEGIFNQFTQAPGARPVRGHVGLGLGLYVARQIARAHGGDLWAESPGPGRGSTFHLALPLESASDLDA